SVSVEVIAPFWKRWWFYILFAIFISGIIYIIYRYRVNELLKRHSIRNKIAQDLHDNIGSTLSSISVYSQVAHIKSKESKEDELKEILDKISVTSNDMITELNDTVWAINPRNDNMEKIILRMESFALPLAAARNIRFNLNCDKTIASLQLDMDKRKNFYLIFKEAVTNAIKYSGASELLVDILLEKNKLLLKVIDNGVGFNREKEMAANRATLSGNGLHNMHKRAIELNGELIISSLPGEGAAISFYLPLT
ncbi:MAG: ATP-binding protein, partial [Chitinophagaceae bacterium]